MILDIVKIKDPYQRNKILNTPCTDVPAFTQEIHDLAENMIDTMVAANGVGLAAPQIGKNINLFVMLSEIALTKDRPTRDAIVLINPHTVIEVGDPYTDREGCLSIPGFLGDVERFKEIGYIAYDTTGKRLGGALKGLPARVYQHEYDHLCGILFPQRATALYRKKKENV